jgi:hypothetical protein
MNEKPERGGKQTQVEEANKHGSDLNWYARSQCHSSVLVHPPLAF